MIARLAFEFDDKDREQFNQWLANRPKNINAFYHNIELGWTIDNLW